MNKIKRGVITEIKNYAQTVVCDDGEVMFLCAMDRVKGGNVGDRVVVEYRSTRTMGLWYGRKEL